MRIVEGNNVILITSGARVFALLEEEAAELGAWLRENRPAYVEPVLESLNPYLREKDH